MNVLVTGANGQLGNHMRLAAPDIDDCSLVFTDVNEASPEQIAVFSKLSSKDFQHSACNVMGAVSQVEVTKCGSPESELQECIDTEILDITDLEAVRKFVKARSVDVIVNCAAYTDVDAAERNYELAELLNAKAVGNLALAMKEVNGFLVHISTDYVFGKEPYNVPCHEHQNGTPTGVYGLTKLHGEQQILASGCKYVILRTAWLYSEFGRNFCKTVLNLLKTKSELKVVCDQTGTPTYAGDLAAAIAVILKDYAFEIKNSALGNNRRNNSHEAVEVEDTDNAGGTKERMVFGGKEELTDQSETCKEGYTKTGIYNYSNDGVCSWFDFAKIIQMIVAEISAETAAESVDSVKAGKRRQFAYSQECTGNIHSGTSCVNYMACEVKPCHSSEFPSPAARPAYSVLDKTKIKETFGIGIPYWVCSLDKCLNNMLR